MIDYEKNARNSLIWFYIFLIPAIFSTIYGAHLLLEMYGSLFLMIMVIPTFIFAIPIFIYLFVTLTLWVFVSVFYSMYRDYSQGR